jgi:hypothetical protein
MGATQKATLLHYRDMQILKSGGFATAGCGDAPLANDPVLYARIVMFEIMTFMFKSQIRKHGTDSKCSWLIFTTSVNRGAVCLRISCCNDE